jgi:hypothetical protein
MPSPLEYVRTQPTARSLALPAFICGICAGPTAIGLAFAASSIPVVGKPDLLALWVLVAVLAGSLIFGCVVRAKLPSDAPSMSRLLANIAIVAPLTWGAAISLFAYYILSQCC